MAADTLKLKRHVSNLLDQVFGAVCGDAASPVAQNRVLRQENATLKRQLALLREADDAELESLHDYVGRLHERVAKLEDAYADLEAAHLEAAAEQSPATTPDKLAVVPVPVPAEQPDEGGVGREVGAVMRRVAPSLERLQGIEAQLGELAALKADMQAAVQALQQAREQPQQPRTASAQQLDTVSKELRALRKAVQRQQQPQPQPQSRPQQQQPGEQPTGAAATAPSKDSAPRAEQAVQRAAGVARPVRSLAECPPLDSAEELGKRRQRPLEDEAPRAKRPADGAVRPNKDLAAPQSAGVQGSPASTDGEITPRGHTSPREDKSEANPADNQQELPGRGCQQGGARQSPEDRLVCAGQRTPGWQNYPWRCPICCQGFKGRYALARHFRSKQHMSFSTDIYEHLARRSASTNQKFREEQHIVNPFPRYNRESGAEMRDSHAVVWCCQICNSRLNGLQHLTHQYSTKHRTVLNSLLDAPPHTPPHGGAGSHAA